MRPWPLLLLALWCIAPPADAIVQRDDRDSRAYIELAAGYSAAVILRQTSNPPIVAGMGTLVDPRWVLTAGHVAETLQPGDLAELGGKTIEIDKVVLHPGWRGFNRREDYLGDIALVRLRDAVAGVTPAALYTGADELGMTVTFVGMGRFGTGLTGPLDESAVMRAATNVVTKAEGTGLEFRFDAPGDRNVTALEGISGDGDSGGPAFVELDGRLFVVGVSSSQDARPADRKIGHYGVLEYYARVSGFAAWIKATLRADRATR